MEILALLVHHLEQFGQRRRNAGGEFLAGHRSVFAARRTMARDRLSVNQNASANQRIVQHGGGEQSGVVDRKDFRYRCMADGDASGKQPLPRRRDALQPHARIATRHRKDTIVEGQIFKRRRERKKRRVAGPRAGQHGHRDHVVVEGQGTDGSAEIADGIVLGPAGRIGIPGEDPVVAHDVAVDAADAARRDPFGKVLDRLQRRPGAAVLLVGKCPAGKRGVAGTHQDHVSGSFAHNARGEAVIRAQALPHHRRRQDLEIRGRQEQAIAVAGIENLAGGHFDHLNAGGGGGRIAAHHRVEALFEIGCRSRWSQRQQRCQPRNGVAWHRDQGAGCRKAWNRPSIQINPSKAATMAEPTSGNAMTARTSSSQAK